MVKVGIINVTGYAGAELARLLYSHPEAELVSVSGRSAAGKPLAEVFPHLACFDLTIDEEIAEVDFAFSALPHAASAEACAPLVRAGVPVVDISADFRLRDSKEYAEWYGGDHPAPELLSQAAYGLTELNREAVQQSKLIANPGCYPESALLALAPAVKAGIIGPEIIIDSKSGISGAGRGLALNTQFGEADESVSAYALGGHRHLPEIEQELERAAGQPVRVTFTPHLAPMSRGILSVCYARARAGTTAQACRDAARALHTGGLVTVLDEGHLPDTLHVRGSARAHLGYALDERTSTVLAIAAIDNLARGASAQAIQALNVSRGWPDALGLPEIAAFP